MVLDKERAMPIIKASLREDIGKGDITTAALVSETASCGAAIIARDDCVACGLEMAEWTMGQIDYSVRFKPNCRDGASVGGGKELAFIEGHAASILRAERVMLNFLALLSGIATMTRRYVEKVRPYSVKVMDTRKTLPLLRYLEKYAVFTGGGTNHRMGLYDQVLIKDNHIAVRSPLRGGSAPLRTIAYGVRRKVGAQATLKELVEASRKGCQKDTVIEIEVTSPKEFGDALAGRPDIIMLDNMNLRDVRTCVEMRKMSRFKPAIEASGGITLENVEQYAKAGVDMISVGALTSSIKPIDISLEIL
jgi:nicotinate-nucleotide pyrophosphorylase (carboxylating)